MSAPRMRVSIIVSIYLNSMRFRIDAMLKLICFYLLFSLSFEWTVLLTGQFSVLSLFIHLPLHGLVCDRMTTTYLDRTTVQCTQNILVQYCWSCCYCYGFCMYFAYAFFILQRTVQCVQLLEWESLTQMSIQLVRAYSLSIATVHLRCPVQQHRRM